MIRSFFPTGTGKRRGEENWPQCKERKTVNEKNVSLKIGYTSDERMRRLTSLGFVCSQIMAPSFQYWLRYGPPIRVNKGDAKEAKVKHFPPPLAFISPKRFPHKKFYNISIFHRNYENSIGERGRFWSNWPSPGSLRSSPFVPCCSVSGTQWEMETFAETIYLFFISARDDKSRYRVQWARFQLQNPLFDWTHELFILCFYRTRFKKSFSCLPCSSSLFKFFRSFHHSQDAFRDDAPANILSVFFFLLLLIAVNLISLIRQLNCENINITAESIINLRVGTRRWSDAYSNCPSVNGEPHSINSVPRRKRDGRKATSQCRPSLLSFQFQLWFSITICCVKIQFRNGDDGRGRALPLFSRRRAI